PRPRSSLCPYTTLFRSDAVGLGVVGVHAAVDVHVAGVPVALVVDGSARVALLDPCGHGLEVRAGVALVAQGPHDDASVVLVAFDHAAHAVEVGLAPLGLVGGVAAPADVDETVGLQVALVDDPHAELVAQVEEAPVRGVVAGAHGVDVVPLHEFDVAAHRLDAQGAPVVGIPFVAVDAAQQDRSAVDLEEAVLDGDGAEAEAQPHAFARGGDDGIVQARRLGGPRFDRDRGALAEGDVDPEFGDADAAFGVGLDAQGPQSGPVV